MYLTPWGLSMICLDRVVMFRGIAVKVAVSALRNEVCENIKQASAFRFDNIKELIKGSGGCYIESEYPLKIVSKDKNLEIIVEPGSFLTKIYWDDVAKKVKNVLCEETS